jgi:hypothetical protein
MNDSVAKKNLLSHTYCSFGLAPIYVFPNKDLSSKSRKQKSKQSKLGIDKVYFINVNALLLNLRDYSIKMSKFYLF